VIPWHLTVGSPRGQQAIGSQTGDIGQGKAASPRRPRIAAGSALVAAAVVARLRAAEAEPLL
jgi:hypothetical protein